MAFGIENLTIRKGTKPRTGGKMMFNPTEDISKALEEMHEENEQLKKRIQELEDELCAYKDDEILSLMIGEKNGNN